MGQFVAGDVVAVRFPFSDLSTDKLRPAIVLAHAEFDDIILCQITSKPYSSKRALTIRADDVEDGKLALISYARPDKLFTAEVSIVSKRLGRLTARKRQALLQRVREQFSAE